MKNIIHKKDIWYNLDNAAKLYPAIISKKDSCVFRVGVNLKKEVIPGILQKAVINLKPRFPSIYVELKPGLFWYYFDLNEKIPLIKEETPYLNGLIDLPQNNNYYFTVFYFHNRISLECFHSLCDGYGAIEFLNAIVFEYLKLLGHKIYSENKILTVEQQANEEELEDSFQKNFTHKIVKPKPVKKAYYIRDIHFPKYYDKALIIGRIKTEELLALAHKNNATITQYLVALLTYSIYRAYKNDDLNNKKRPINVCIPINLRRFFNSKTLRNFSLFFYTSVCCNKGEMNMDDILNKVKKDFESEVDKDKLQSNLNQNVAYEKGFFMKICPLFIKNIVIRTGANILGNSLNTIILSNLGNIDIPLSMSKHILNYNFNLSGNYSKVNNVGVVSSNGITTISFGRTIYETKIEEIFFTFLSNEGLNVEIESNILEKYV